MPITPYCLSVLNRSYQHSKVFNLDGRLDESDVVVRE